jgi:hypothetical protein
VKRTGIARKTPLKAKAAKPKPRKAIQRKRRSDAEYERIYGSEARVQWISSLRCACGCGGTPCENAHAVTGGTGRKGDADTILPLAPKCHRKQHERGWEAIGMTRYEAIIIASQVQKMWVRRSGG